MATTNGGKVFFGPPERGKDAGSRAPTGRRCEVPGCTTVLSIYNDATTCWLHSSPSLRHALARR